MKKGRTLIGICCSIMGFSFFIGGLFSTIVLLASKESLLLIIQGVIMTGTGVFLLGIGFSSTLDAFTAFVKSIELKQT